MAFDLHDLLLHARRAVRVLLWAPVVVRDEALVFRDRVDVAAVLRLDLPDDHAVALEFRLYARDLDRVALDVPATRSGLRVEEGTVGDRRSLLRGVVQTEG